MAVPKRRSSKSRKNMRRAHHALTVPTVIKCSRCGTQIAPHTICPECGFYRGKPIIEVGTEA